VTIDKIFLFNKETIKQLEEITKFKGKTQTETLQELIEDEYKKIRVKKKLEALDKLAGCLTGKIGDIDLKQIRIERAIHRVKYKD